MRFRGLVLIVILLLLSPALARADHLNSRKFSGPAKVIGGGVLIVEKKRIALYGINRIAIAVLPWGPRARAALHRLTTGKQVHCRLQIHRDDYEIAICRVGKLDLAEALVRLGLATADRETTELYAPAEVAAEKNRAGFWK